jgi:hypothetical protein
VIAIWQSGMAKKLLVIWLYRIARRSLAILQQPIAKHVCWQFWQPLIAQPETIELVAFIRLGGVNNVFSHVSLILVASFLFCRAFLGCTGI